MIKTILTATIIALATTPVFAETSQSPAVKTVTPSATFSSFSSLTPPPSMALHVADVTSPIVCRAKVRAKYFELGGKDMSNPESNGQWATIGTMQAGVWCRGTQAFIAVAGRDLNSVAELRDEIYKAF